MSDIRKTSLEELQAKKDRGEIKSPDVDALEHDLPDAFWDGAQLRLPEPKQAISLRVDRDVLEFFKADGPGHLTRMHAVLRAYVEAKRTHKA